MKNRFLIEKQNINGDNIIIAGEEFCHLYKVLRLRVGDSIECFFEGSDIFVCTLTQVANNLAVAKIVGTKKCEANPKISVTVFQALPKLDKLELITEKLVELGVSEIVPFASTFTNAKPQAVRTDRLNKIVISAAKQCGRTDLLKVNAPVRFKEVLEMLKNFKTVIFANETEEKQTLGEVFKKSHTPQAGVAIIIGSEGGFNKQEIDDLIKAGAKSVSLGKRILRTETAAIVMTALVMERILELGVKGN